MRVSAGVVVLSAALLSSATTVVAAEPCWEPAVSAPIVDPFRMPSCTWCAGNRGIEYATAQGEAVRAVAAGEVTFSGSIAGTTYVVVRHGDGLRVTYGNLAQGTIVSGDVGVAGMLVGTAAGHLHFGVRRGDDYIDPAPMLGTLVGVPRLVPTDGSPGAAAPPAVVRCRV